MEDAQHKKTKARSPSYPSIGLKEAVEKITAIYNNDYQNAIPRIVVAAHMGYQGLNGKSLGVLAALAKYGLLEGRGNDNKVSDLAVKIIAHPSGTKEFVDSESKGYNPQDDKQEDSMTPPDAGQTPPNPPAPPAGGVVTPPAYIPPATGRQAIFALAEGDVVINFPEDLSPESVADLADYLEIFMKKAKREAGIN